MNNPTRSSGSRKAVQRCPSCRSRVASNEATCPICGYDFAGEPAGEPAAPTSGPLLSGATELVPETPARASKPWPARLPWGVIGVIAVIFAIAAGAVLLLQDGDALTGLEPTATAVVQQTIAPLDSSITQAAAAPAPASPTPTAQNPAGASPEGGTPIPNETETPTSEPAPAAPEPTAAPQEYEVKAGDTCGRIAQQFGVTVDELIRANRLSSTCFIRVGDKLLIPAPTPTPGPSPTLAPDVTLQPTETAQPTATLPPQIIYQVRAGDTCGEIAERFRMPLDSLIEQNDLDPNCLIQIGQVLTLTFATPAPVMTPTPIVAQTPTPRAGYPAPELLRPIDDAVISETQETVTLEWLSVGLLRDNEWYVVQVQPSDAVTVPVFETKATSLKLTRALLNGESQREFAWWVQVKQFLGNEASGARAYRELSLPSAVRRFRWGQPPVSPTPPGRAGRFGGPAPLHDPHWSLR